MLLDDYLDPSDAVGTDADPEGFHRRLLQVFRDSQADSAYGDWLKKLSPDEQKRIADFVNGNGLDSVSKGYKSVPSLGVREHVQLMLGGEAGPVVVDGLNNRVHGQRDGPFLRKIIDDLTDLFTYREKDSITVRMTSCPYRQAQPCVALSWC